MGDPQKTSERKAEANVWEKNSSTNNPHAEYGTVPRYQGGAGDHDQIADSNVNDVDTPNNPTTNKQIRKANAGPMPETSYGRAMSM